MKILLLGKNGQVGSELRLSLASLGELIALNRSELDLTDETVIREKIRSLRPDVIVNAAAYTAVDKAESEADLAMLVNGVAPEIMAQEAASLGALLVHYSTDYVFDGTKSSPYTERDITHPLNIYGHSKLAGEQAICAQTTRYLILRTTWVYDAYGKNFLNTIKRVAAQRSELSIVNDQIGAPTWSREIARATTKMIGLYGMQGGLKQQEFRDPEQNNLSGIYNLTAQGQTSWFEFAQAATEFGLFAELAQAPTLRPIPSKDYPTPAARPMYSVLSNAKLLEQFGIQLQDWKSALCQCLSKSEHEAIRL